MQLRRGTASATVATAPRSPVPETARPRPTAPAGSGRPGFAFGGAGGPARRRTTIGGHDEGRGGRGRIRRVPRGPDAASAARGSAEIVLVNPTDYFLYLPLLPEVTAGILDPRRIAVSLAASLPGVRLVSASRARIDPDARHGELPRPGRPRPAARLRPAADRRRQRQQAAADPRGRRVRARLPRPRGGALPARPPGPPDRARRRHRRPGRAHGPAARSWWSAPATPAPRSPRRACSPPGPAAQAAAARGRTARWLLLDTAARVLPELRPTAVPHGATGCSRARRRGHTGTSVEEALADGVLLTDGSTCRPGPDLVRRGAARPAGRDARAAHRAAAG